MADNCEVYLNGHGCIRQVILHRTNRCIHHHESNLANLSFIRVILQIDEETR